MATGYKSEKCWNIWNGAQFLTPTCRCHCHLTWPNWRILWAMGVDWLLDIMDHHCGRCTKHLAPSAYVVPSLKHWAPRDIRISICLEATLTPPECQVAEVERAMISFWLWWMNFDFELYLLCAYFCGIQRWGCTVGWE